MKPSLTVGQLKEQLKNLSDNLPVYINPLEEDIKSDCHYVKRVEYSAKCAIANECLLIMPGEPFYW